MNSYYYSPSMNVFAASESVLLTTEPFSDAFPISNAIFEEYFCGEKEGKRRVAGHDGYPSWEDIPPPTEEELQAVVVQEAENKKTQLLAIAAENTKELQTDLLLGVIGEKDKEVLIKWRNYMKSLESVDTSVAPNIVWPEQP